MRFAALVCAGLIVAGCDVAEAPERSGPEQYSAAEIKEHLPGITDACVDKHLSGDAGAVPTDQCFEMQEPRRFRGLWRNVFEGSRFCPEPAFECEDGTPGDRFWLSFAEGVQQERIEPTGGLYSIDFVGRRTLRRARHGMWGHYDYEVIVDRVISMREAFLAGSFPELEDELAGLSAGGGYDGPTRSPDRADAMVWALTELSETRSGVPRVTRL